MRKKKDINEEKYGYLADSALRRAQYLVATYQPGVPCEGEASGTRLAYDALRAGKTATEARAIAMKEVVATNTLH